VSIDEESVGKESGTENRVEQSGTECTRVKPHAKIEVREMMQLPDTASIASHAGTCIP
jgi:hypothetical protein